MKYHGGQLYQVGNKNLPNYHDANITYLFFLCVWMDSKYPKIDDFGNKIEFESWVNLSQVIKNIKK